MTVQSTLSRNDYIGNGLAVDFQVTFRFLNKTHLRVFRTVIATNVTTELTLDSLGPDGFSVTGAGQPTGGQVHVVTAPSSLERLSILRNMPFTQLIDYIANDPFPAESHERGLDERTMENQQLREVTERAIVLPPQTTGVSTELPGPVALNLLRWKADLSGLENAAPPSIATVADGAVVDATVSPIAGIRASKLAFTQSGTGAAIQTIEQKLKESVSVLDFMSDAQRTDVITNAGALDVSVPVQAALAAHPAVDFPAGTYRITSVEVFFGRVLTGRGAATKILANDDTSDVFRVTSANVTISGFYFGNRNEGLAPALGAYRTTGCYINISGPRAFVSNVYAQYGAIGVRSTGSIVTLTDCEFRNFRPGTGICVDILDGADVSLYGIITDHSDPTQPLAGVHITNAADVTITDCNIIRSGFDLFVNPGNGEGVASLNALNTFFDTAVGGVRMAPTGTGTITRCYFTNCWASSHTGAGILLTTSGGGTIKGVTFESPQVFLNGTDGINLMGAATEDVTISGGHMSQNAGAGISIGNGVSGWVVRDVRSGPSSSAVGNAYGLFVGTGCLNYRVMDSNFLGNTTGNAAFADTTTTAIIAGNLGLVPPTFAPTFAGTWVDFGGAEAAVGYWKDGEGLVHLQGHAKNGVIGTAIFTLPAGFRPPANMQFPVVSAGLFGAASVDAAGVVTAQAGNAAGFALDGIVFKAA